MKSKVFQVALKILLLLEEYSASDISAAIKIIEDGNSNARLLKFLSERVNKVPKKAKRGKTTKSVPGRTPSPILKFKDTDPEKFLILENLDSLLRKKLILKNLNNIKTLAAKFSKDFPDFKSRREALPKLLEMISDLPLDTIKEITEVALNESEKALDRSEYQELARYLIRGSKSANNS